MALKNTQTDYGLIAKSLHWLIALLFLCAYVSVYFRQWYTEEKTPENWLALQTHLSIGITIGVFVILRIIWKLSNPTPDPEPGSPFEHMAAKIGHILLYAIMIIAPITGYVGTGVDTEFFNQFIIPGAKETIFNGDKAAFEGVEKIIDFIHKDLLGEALILLLVGGHIGAALYHHFVKKDRTLKRMSSGKQ